MNEYINLYNKNNPYNGNGKGALAQIILFGPICWNGGPFTYSRELYKKCWFCDNYHA